MTGAELRELDRRMENLGICANYDLGFRTITRSDLGLSPNEVWVENLTAVSLRSKPAHQDQFDELALKQAIQGMINRHAPMIWLDPHDFMHGTKLWPNEWVKYYGETQRLKFTEKRDNFEYFLKRVGSVFNGIILYEPIPTDNIFLALNLANVNGCLPVSRRLYEKYGTAIASLPIIAELNDHGLTRLELYNWMIRHLLPQCDRTMAFCPSATFEDITPGSSYTGGNGHEIGMDYAFYTRSFIFNVSGSFFERDVLGTVAGGSDQGRIFERIMEGLIRPAAFFGWTLDHENYYVQKLAEYGHYIDCSSGAASLSFHAALKPLAPVRLTQSTAPSKATPEAKCYISFVANEGDTINSRIRMYHDAWLSPVRGKFPVNWPINPDNINRFPAMMEYYFRNKSDNDYFVLAPSGAGYLAPAYSPHLEEFIQYTRERLSNAELKEMEAWYSDQNSLEIFADTMPELRGMTISHNEHLPYGEVVFAGKRRMPVIRYIQQMEYWFVKEPFVEGEPDFAVPDTFRVDAGKVAAFLENVAANVALPAFVPIYGVDKNTLDISAKIIAALDPNLFEVVDHATMFHLAGQCSDLPIGQRRFISPEDNNVDESKSITWSKDCLRKEENWEAMPSQPRYFVHARGLRIEVAEGHEEGFVAMWQVKLPKPCNRIRIQVAELSTNAKWEIRLVGDFNGYGLTDDHTRPFGWGGSRLTGELSESLDYRIRSKFDKPMERLEIGVYGPPGSYAVIQALDITE